MCHPLIELLRPQVVVVVFAKADFPFPVRGLKSTQAIFATL
jgi:hypothetical protein